MIEKNDDGADCPPMPSDLNMTPKKVLVGTATMELGVVVGPSERRTVGTPDPSIDGFAEGDVLGSLVGLSERRTVGAPDSSRDGFSEGAVLGSPVGISEPSIVGTDDSSRDGFNDGTELGV